MRVVRASPSERRRFLDRALYGYNPSCLAILQSYDKVLRNRNTLLREGGQPSLLDVYDQQLATWGAQVIFARKQYLKALTPLYQDAFATIAPEDGSASLLYTDKPLSTEEKIAVEVEEDKSQSKEDLTGLLAARLEDSRAKDYQRGATTVGPHRDDLVFCIQGRSASAYASQGQFRALVLAWKIAEMKLLGESEGDWPILLLDDISSELDPSRNACLFDFLRGTPSQCFITTTHSSMSFCVKIALTLASQKG